MSQYPVRTKPINTFNMCCHRLYVYTVCGHSVLSSKPLIECRHASIEPDGYQSTDCEIIAHPYQSWKIETLCPPCQQQRDTLMSRIEAVQTVKFDEWRWKVSYGMPAHGKDFWGRRADEREQREQQQEKEVREEKRKSKPFSLKRKSTRKFNKGPRTPTTPQEEDMNT
jgi:hypothetical protein